MSAIGPRDAPHQQKAGTLSEPKPPSESREPGTENIVREPITPAIRIGTYTPAAISVINASLLWGSSQIFRRRFDAGVNEWRLLTRIAILPGTTAAEAAKAIGVDKAILSRTVATMRAKQLIATERRGGVRGLYLTEAGVSLYQQMRPIAEAREQILLADLDEEERTVFRGFLRRLMARREALSEYDARALDSSQDDAES